MDAPLETSGPWLRVGPRVPCRLSVAHLPASGLAEAVFAAPPKPLKEIRGDVVDWAVECEG